MKTHPETRALWQTEIRRAAKYLPDTRDNNENVSNRDIVTLTKSLFESFGIETR